MSASRLPFRLEMAGRLIETHHLAAAVGALFDLDLALGETLRPDQNLPRNTDQVGGGEFAARTLVGVVVEHVHTRRRQFLIELLAGGVGFGSALLQEENGDAERRALLRPLDAVLVVAGIDDRAAEARNAGAVGAAMDRLFRAVRAHHR